MLEFGYSLLCRKYGLGPLLRPAQVVPPTLQSNLFQKNSLYLLVFWFVSHSWGVGAGLTVGFFHSPLYCILVVEPFFSPSFFFFFLFFSLKGFLWEKFSGLPSSQCHNSQLYCLIQVLQAASEVEPNEIKGFFINASTRMCWYG